MCFESEVWWQHRETSASHRESRCNNEDLGSVSRGIYNRHVSVQCVYSGTPFVFDVCTSVTGIFFGVSEATTQHSARVRNRSLRSAMQRFGSPHPRHLLNLQQMVGTNGRRRNVTMSLVYMATRSLREIHTMPRSTTRAKKYNRDFGRWVPHTPEPFFVRFGGFHFNPPF